MTQDIVLRDLLALAARSRRLPRDWESLDYLGKEWRDQLGRMGSNAETILRHDFEEYRQKMFTGPPGVDEGEGPEAACPAPAQEAAPAVPIIDAEDFQILSTLNRFHPVLKQLGDIETESKITRKTISARLPALIQSGLVERPRGERGGIRLSPKGRDFLDTCPQTTQ